MRDQFWTTRGYAVVQVNYVGSSGFGRDYLRALNGQWGLADTADTVSCVEYLVKEGKVDGKRVGITGHSAGGYLTLQAMCMYPDVWRCGVAESGISDMQAMVEETHKFEVSNVLSLRDAYVNVVARRPCTLLMLFTVSILETASLSSWLYGRRRSPYHSRTQPCKSPSHAPLISNCDTMSSFPYFLYTTHLSITFMYSSPTFAPPSSLYPTTTTPITKPNPHTHKLIPPTTDKPHLSPQSPPPNPLWRRR